MKKLLVIVLAGMIMAMLIITACNSKARKDYVNNGMITTAMVETGITVAEKSKVVFIRQSFLTNDRLKSLTMALGSMEYRKEHGELVTSVKVEEDEDWPGWYRAWFTSTIAE